MLFEESIMKDIQQVLDRIAIYDKKNVTMGLTVSEEQLYSNLAIQYILLRVHLFDSIFNKYVLPDILYEEAEELAEDIYEFIGWDVNILIDTKEMDSIYNRYIEFEDKNLVLEKIRLMKRLLKKNLTSEYIKLDDREIWECISVLISDGESKSPNILLSHLDNKFDSIYKTLREEEE